MNISWYQDLTNDEKNLLSMMGSSYFITLDPQQLGPKCKDIKSLVKNHSYTINNEAFEGLICISKSSVSESIYDKSLRTINRLFSYCFSPSEENKSSIDSFHDSHVVASVSHISSSYDLFDSPVMSSSHLSIQLNKAEFYQRDAAYGDAYEPKNGQSILMVALSPDQYVRAMRSNSSCIPCTIKRSFSQINSELPNLYSKSEVIRKNLKEDLEASTHPLKKSVDEFISMTEGKSFSSKKQISVVEDKFNEVVSIYKSISSGLVELQKDSAKKVAENHVSRLQNNIDYEINRLPESVQDAARKSIGKLMIAFDDQ